MEDASRLIHVTTAMRLAGNAALDAKRESALLADGALAMPFQGKELDLSKFRALPKMSCLAFHRFQLAKLKSGFGPMVRVVPSHFRVQFFQLYFLLVLLLIVKGQKGS